VGSRGNPKSKSKDEVNLNTAGVTLGKAKDSKTEFEDERTRSDTFDFSPRLNVKLAGGDELILSPWFSRTADDKAKRVDTVTTKYSYDGAGVLTGTTVTPSSKTEDEDKLRQVARLRGEWKHKLADGASLSVYAAVQGGGEEKDKTALEYNAAGTLTKTTLEHDDKDEQEWYAGGKFARALGRHKLSSGLEYRDKARQDEKTKLENGAPKAAGRGDTFDIDEQRWVAFLQDEIDLAGGHFLTPGLRAQWNEQAAVDGLGQTTGGRTDNVSPSLHYLWQVNGGNNLRASLTQTLKPPKFDELSTVTESKSGTTSDPDKSGNPNLGPEKALGAELAWEHFLPRAGGVLGANLFYRDIQDKIEERTELEGARYVSRPQNVGDARVWGVELDARPRMDIIGLPELMLRFNYTRLFSELKNAATGLETRIKDQPPYVYNVGFDWQLPKQDAAWGVNYNYTPRFIKNPAETTKLDPESEQKLLDMYVMKRLSKDFALRFTASNLLDMKKEKDKSGFTSGGVLSKNTVETERGGRGFFLALEGKF
jgi:iron complex outermembrane receptor protein